MHEVDMTKCLLLSLNEWKQQHAPSIPEVSTIHLQVGDFTCVEPDALLFTWGALVKDGWLGGSELRIERVPLVARCPGCEHTYAPEATNAYRSPCCDQPMEEIVTGRELRIRSIDYQLPSATPESTAVPASTAVSTSTAVSASTPASATRAVLSTAPAP